ncbi:hypothetical protein KMB31_00110 [Streptomyces sp. CYG21]|nr:hypothetical protein [Streptomyces sp. CYG21]
MPAPRCRTSFCRSRSTATGSTPSPGRAASHASGRSRGRAWTPQDPRPPGASRSGRAIGRHFRSSGERVAFVASSSWSHAFLTDKLWHIRPDTAADRRLYDLMVAGDIDALAAVTGAEVVDAGQHEILNWFCMLGAVDELGLELDWSALVTTDVFNSNKPFAVYR